MKTIKTLILIVTLAICSYSQNYKQVKIFLKDLNDVGKLQSIGLEFDHPHFTKDNAIEVFINESEFQLLQSSPFRYEILIEDWEAYYDALPKLSNEEIQRFAQKAVNCLELKDFILEQWADI